MDTLDEILSEEVADVEEVEQETVEQVESEPEGKPRDEKGRFAPKGEEEGASPAPVEEPPFDHAAVKGERERRQKAEQRARELEEQIQALQQPQQPQEPQASIWEDDAKWQEQFGTQVVNQAVNQATFNAKLDMSEMMVRQAHDDFDEIKDKFLELAKENPALTQQALSDPHPWNKAYQIAKNHSTMQELGATDLEGMKAKLREELLAEMAAQTPATRQAIPTLSGERNLGGRGGPEWAGPPALEDLLK
jgi:hypothetical protein